MHDILSSKIDSKGILLDHNLISLKKQNEKYLVSFENKKQKEFDYIIATDGIFSKVRDTLFGEIDFRDSHQVCWRFVMDMPSELKKNRSFEMWGDQQRVGIFPLGDNKLYCYMVASIQGGEKNLNLVDVMKKFNSFEGDWNYIKNAINPNSTELLYNELRDIKDITLQKDGIVFIGDAGHSTTPNLGQGAAMAIESAYSFYKLLKENNYDTAVQKYQEERYSRVKLIREKSMLIGNLIHTKSPWKQKLRDSIIRVLPQSFSQKEVEKIVIT